MSKRPILLTIDAREHECGNCSRKHICECGETITCEVFGDEMSPCGLRLPECLEAEKLAKGVKK